MQMIENKRQDNNNGIDAKKRFNEFQAQTYVRIETTIKFVLLISGGMLTLSIGAVLSDKPAHITTELLPYLKFAWGRSS